MKLTRKQAIAALLFGIAGHIIGQDKFKYAEFPKFEPMWLEVDGVSLRGVRIRHKGKMKEISMDEIWEALQ